MTITTLQRLSDNDTDSDEHDVDSNPPDEAQPMPQSIDDNDDDEEPWVDWIRRCTHEAESQLKSMGVDDWVADQRRRKWRWAAKTATDTVPKWNVKALLWKPELDSRYNARRRPGRPMTRWTDDLTKFCNEHAPLQHTDCNNKAQVQDIFEPLERQKSLETIGASHASSCNENYTLHPSHYYNGSSYENDDALAAEDAVSTSSTAKFVDWMEIAADKCLWEQLEQEYVQRESSQ